MPNWCSNNLVIRATPRRLVEFARANQAMVRVGESEDKGLAYSFGGLVPQPDDATALWAVSNWGTKWDIDPSELSFARVEGGVSVFLTTAWDPPSSWLEAAGDAFPDVALDLYAAESGNGILSRLSVHGPDRWFRDYASVFENSPGDVTIEELRALREFCPDEYSFWSHASVSPSLWSDPALASEALDYFASEDLENHSYRLLGILRSMPAKDRGRLLRSCLEENADAFENALAMSDEGVSAILPLLDVLSVPERRALADRFILSDVALSREIARQLYVALPPPRPSRRI